MFTTMLGKGFNKFMNFLKKGSLNGIKIIRKDEVDISKIQNENSNLKETQKGKRNNSTGSKDDSFEKNNLRFTPYLTDSPKENRLHPRKIMLHNLKNRYTYFNELCKSYLNPLKDAKEKIYSSRNEFSDSQQNSTEEALIPNKIKNRIFQFQKPANYPIEDRINSLQLNNLDAYFVSVLDGHGGDFVAEYANNLLHLKLEERLLNIGDINIIDANLKEALTYAFDEVEKEYYQHALNKFENGDYKYAFIGSCVLCIVVHGNHLYVANCGDSKAKLFRRGEFKGDLSKLIPIKISNLHNAGNFEEQKKLRAKFKNEKDIIVDKNTASYVKGRLQPTKTIGDLFLKHKKFNEPLDILNETTLKYSRKFIPNFSGPYIDHFPEILTFELTENDEFIVLGSDGLWDWLDGFEVAEILDKFCHDKSKVLHELSSKALLRAASKVGMNIEELEQLPKTARRSIYDDISIIVVDLKNQVPKSTNKTS